MTIRTTQIALLFGAGVLAGCAGGGAGGSASPAPMAFTASPRPDPRVGLKAGLYDAGEASWNMRLASTTKSPPKFEGSTNSDLAFTGKYAIQGNYNGYQVWDISNPAKPVLTTAFFCPASQSDVSVYKNLLFVSGEGQTGRLDCGAQGVSTAVSKDRLRGLRIFDITDIANPKNVGNVQTCRGSHTHTVLEDPKDKANVYVYISGSANVRSADELPGCVNTTPDKDPNSALFRIEVIKVPLADPSKAAIVSSPRIFNDLTAPKGHGASPADAAEMAKAKAAGAFIADVGGEQMILPSGFVRTLLDSVVKARGGAGAPTGADSSALRAALPAMIAKMIGQPAGPSNAPRPGPTQCHDITVYPGIGLAGGACEGYGLLLDISNPANPVRIAAVADSNFSYWHSATFNNDGTKVLFSDEWGGGGGPKCRADDPKQWGADAIFTIENRQLKFRSYYKLPAPQTSLENCVAHNGSLIPVPGRDIMVQAWYQGGISVFDWTDAAHPTEIAFFDRGPIAADHAGNGGSWSVYWYNGAIVSSEIARGLDIFELVPNANLTQNEIDAAKTVVLDHLNTQGQPKFTWAPTFALARAYTDQLERSRGLSSSRITSVRQALLRAEQANGTARRDALTALANEVNGDAGSSKDALKVRALAAAVRDLAAK
ncbi:MAG: hypothetical protein IPO52_10655 [Gemmatimonadetes bacterium]|nr:hypothetical protein [Gemmatimonadota bacterium]